VSANHQEVITSNKEENRSKKSFLSEENYQLLKQYQQRVSEATGFSPDVRKIVNDLITVENMEKIITKYIKHWSNKIFKLSISVIFILNQRRSHHVN